MDPQLAAILAASIVTAGTVVVALISRGRTAPPADHGRPDVQSATDTAADRIDVLVDELVAAHNDLRGLRSQVYVCTVDACPVRDQLRKERER